MLPIELETFQLCPLICKSLRLMDQGFKGLYLLTTSSCSHQKVSPEIFQLKHEFTSSWSKQILPNHRLHKGDSCWPLEGAAYNVSDNGRSS